MRVLVIFSLSILIFSTIGCSPKAYDDEAFKIYSKEQLNIWNKIVTDIMVKDIFSPPVASRIYAYPNITAHEILTNTDTSLVSLSNTIKHLKDIPEPQKEKKYNFEIAAIIGFSMVAEDLVYSYDIVAHKRKVYLEKIKTFGISQEVINNSVEYGVLVADHIKKWANNDGYKSRNNHSQIINDKGEGTWKPTPPDFLEPIEPNWHRLRTFVIDSAGQFSSGEPTDFDIDKLSPFYKESIEVYDAVRNASTEQLEIAKFWDCNPNASTHTGHIMKFEQKISPGAHWMLIASHVSKKQDLGFIERARVFTFLSVTLADSFISCWNDKYKTVVIRPETYINRYIDKSWRPVLQTPAFPEYTSGHSVASAASAAMLSEMLGHQTAFTDSTEVEYGLPIRSFVSFKAAAEEAAISRLYGGIHYMPAITNGVKQGNQIGNYISKQLIKKN
ncbi:phosphatase PAP2 family protein [Aquimarina sp. AD10]|uniref:vanadium-dependent haloperoxidase n=1 Tax=Aquimarina TaxID=290174 RepID=UPI000E5353A3|nr:MULTISPECIES: vanadium-dependent haloperoxidase [Aquimarina]AXT59331.1 phosphatase PAP2 family protein [Aquimarina sp. AD10]RKM95163.1 phosphatase PAP2 family protein [Aquimarina sp. AD10]